MTTEPRPLDQLLDRARDAEPGERINLRDAIAEHGEAAIDAMADWLSDRRLAAFAIRVIERIGSDPAHRAAAVESIARTDRTDWPSYMVEDTESVLARLGYRLSSTRRSPGRGKTERPLGSPGRPGRRYWVMRTSPWERPHLWAEALEGRLRQGWGVADEQDLHVIAETLGRGGELSGLQREARRALRMLASWPGGMNVEDIVVAPNLPNYGRLSVFRVADSYRWELGPAMTWGERFGHVLPVELISADIGRHERVVSDGLRSVLRAQTRLYNITGYGGDVERLIGGDVEMDRHRQSWTEKDYEALFGRFPADAAEPTPEEVDELGMELGRTPDAILWQWQDGANYVQGRSASTTSDVLKQWLDGRSQESAADSTRRVAPQGP